MTAWTLFLIFALVCFIADAFWNPPQPVKLFSSGWAFVIAAWLATGSVVIR